MGRDRRRWRDGGDGGEGGGAEGGDDGGGDSGGSDGDEIAHGKSLVAPRVAFIPPFVLRPRELRWPQ